MHLHFVPQVGETCFLVPKFSNLAKEHRPEQARPHIGVVTDVVTAVVRTVVRAIGSRTVRVVEHPKRSRRRQRHETTVATDLSLQPIPPSRGIRLFQHF